MCLDSIKEQNDRPSTMIMSGWKEFNGSGKNLQFQNMILNGKPDVSLDEWIVAEKKPITANDGKKYETGFHAYTDEKELSNYNTKYRHVYMRKVMTIGKQGSLTVAIAEEMYVPSDPNDWPPKPGDPPKKESILDKAKKIVGKTGNA
jgi:hypothetical protein